MLIHAVRRSCQAILEHCKAALQGTAGVSQLLQHVIVIF